MGIHLKRSTGIQRKMSVESWNSWTRGKTTANYTVQMPSVYQMTEMIGAS